MALIAIGLIVGLVCFAYATNIGQLVHGSENPTRLEKIGRR